MNKEQSIKFIEEQVSAGTLSKGDLLDIAHKDGDKKDVVIEKDISKIVVAQQNSKNIINIFYTIGAIIVLVGVTILIVEHWDEIGFIGRILITLGIAAVTYGMALVLNKPHQKMISQVMFVISAILAPIGAAVVLSQMKFDFGWANQIIVSFILFIVYGAGLIFSKKNILVLICIAFASWIYFAIVMKIGSDYSIDSNFLQWCVMLLGACYIIFAYGYRNAMTVDKDDVTEKESIRNVLYGLGTLAVLGSGIFIGGVFDLVLILLIFGAFYGSVYLRSRAMLMFAAIFMVAHLIKLTSKYFYNSIGFSISLIIVGFLVIGIGYGTYYLNKTYISAR